MFSKTFLITLFLILIIGSSLGLTYLSYQITAPLLETAPEREFVIEPGEGFREIAQRLEDEKFIRSSSYFILYTTYRGWADKLKPGRFKLSASESISEIAKKIVVGKKWEEVKVTIPEGYTVDDIDKKLSGLGLIEEGALLNFQPSEKLLSKYEFLRFLPEDELRIGNWEGEISYLEGFLFPDTYIFFKTETKETEPIIEKFLDNFSRKITLDLEDFIKENQLSLYDVLIMASMIEKEVPFSADRPIVAGILWKRLKDQILLQVDATVLFAKQIASRKELRSKIKNSQISCCRRQEDGEKLRSLTKEDMEIDSPYNTYKYKGLPPGPICNPGLEAIEAAIFPRESDYWYYLSDPKTKKTIFSKTFEEHKRAIRIYLTNN